MLSVRKTEDFAKWIDRLKDARARVRILVRIERLAGGNPGDVKPVGDGVSELRVSYRPGYRVYFTHIDDQIIILLVGGQNKRQSADIKRALELARSL